MGFDITLDDSSVDTDVSTAETQSTQENVYGVQADGTQIGTNRGDSSDEVNPRKLVSDPSINDIRWFYRRTFAKKLVDKPVDDAFKNGYEFTGRDATRAQQIVDTADYEDTYKLAEKNSRRDGFSLLFAVLRDTSDGPHVNPFNENVRVDSVQAINILTVDDLTDTPPTNFDEQLPIRHEDVEIRDTGIVTDKRVTSPRYNDPIGYLVEQGNESQFIHYQRVQHLTWNREVSGDVESDVLGTWEGDSVLMPSIDLIKGIKKANWSIAQTLFRYASKMYAIKLPADANEEDQKAADEELRNLNSKSEIVLPSADYEIEDFQTDGQLDPRNYFDVLFEQICASSEMTKSVLFGTQQGTVTGSETDIKNYFNKVERYRRTRVVRLLRDFVEKIIRLTDGRAASNYEATFDVEWGPMFQLNDLDRAEVQNREIQTVQTAVNGFVMTPDEARSILSEKWADVDLDALTDTQREWLEDINLSQQGADPDKNKGSTQQQNGGGRSKGDTNASSSPTTDNAAIDGYDIL